LLKIKTTNSKTSSVTSNFFSYSTRSNISEHRFCKKDIEQAKVIGQLDNKFIACKLPCTQNIEQDIEENEIVEQRPRNILILVDQHAADERVRVEMLFKEFCESKQLDRMDVKDSNKMNAISFVETIQLNPSNKIILTFRESQVVGRFESNFNKWGIFFSDKCEAKSDSTSNIPTTSFVSPHFVSSKDGDLIPLYVTHLPKMIADRCVLDTRITQELVRQHLYWLEETGGVGTDFNADGNIDESREWQTMIRKCPRGIVDILNSKACRGN
jgi:DNA mismatch repair protein MLH3